MTSNSFTPACDQVFGLAQHVGGRARDEIAAQLRDDAEGAAVVAAFGDLEVGVMARRRASCPAAAQDRETDRATGGTARCTASMTLSYCCGPVIASTLG